MCYAERTTRSRHPLSGKERKRDGAPGRGIWRGRVPGWIGNYFEFSTFEWQPRPIDYYRVEQTRVLDRSQSSVARTRRC